MAFVNTLHLININSWDVTQVAEWLKGLDDSLTAFLQAFQLASINGKRLLILTNGDLEKLGVQKLGHQEMIMQAIELLCNLQYDLDRENLQSLALKLRCKASGLQSLMLSRNQFSSDHTTRRLPLSCLSIISDVVLGCKDLVCWLDRPPFDTGDNYSHCRNKVVTWGKDLIGFAQVDNPLSNKGAIIDLCKELMDFCDSLIQDSRDPLTIQPAYLELTTIRKRPEEELGMHIHSSYNGTHTIGGIKDESPAYLCGKIEEGDEVVQVNYQVVVGWQLKKLVNALKKNPKEVALTLKKRPRHVVFGQQANRRKISKKIQQATFPKAVKRRSNNQDKNVRSPLTDLLRTTTLPPPSEPFNERFTTNTATTNTSSGTPESQETDLDTDNDVFRSGSESPGYHLEIESKHRRATVSGGSPTLQRPHIEINDLTVAGRPKSYTISLGSPSSESEGHSLGSPGSEGLASPDTDFKWIPQKSGVDIKTSSPINISTTSQTHLPTPSVFTPNPPVIELHVNSEPEESPKRRRASEAASMEIPGHTDQGTPQLVRVRRLGSNGRPETSDDESSTDKKEDPTARKSEAGGYTVTLVGGVPQRVPVSPHQSPMVPLRRIKAKGANRRISCKDLGRGDCQGWLYKKKERSGILAQGAWVKRWFVLKDKKLFYYNKDKSEERAEGVIYLPGFQITPYTTKGKKFAFKAHHSGTTFHFASETQEDMGKWMNKMGLAAISVDTPDSKVLYGFSRQKQVPEEPETYSETDSDSESQTDPAPVDPAAETHEIGRLYKSIRRAEVGIDGQSKKARRMSHITRTDVVQKTTKEESAYVESTRKLLSLERTLTDKQNDLDAIEHLLEGTAISAENLKAFMDNYPDILNKTKLSREDSSSEESLATESSS